MINKFKDEINCGLVKLDELWEVLL
jgi:hypothetical protein